MHKWVYEKAEALKGEICSIGCDNLTKENLEEAYYISKILKNLVCIDKEYHIVDAMEKAENEDNMEMIERFTDYPEKRFYNNNRSANGRYTTKGSGSRTGRIGYDEMMPMDVEMYRSQDYDKMRDIDRHMGRMFYPDGMNSNSGSRDAREGKSGQSRIRYFESKAMGDTQTKMHKLEEYMKDMFDDLTEMLSDASPEEKQMAKQKTQVYLQKM